LKKRGFIKKYVAILDNKKMGLTKFLSALPSRAYTSFLEKFVKKINNFPEVVECHRVAGNYDLLSKVSR
jgi:DNA-binding Lrp family transcriptional regulator